jgi:hypothetical protein
LPVDKLSAGGDTHRPRDVPMALELKLKRCRQLRKVLLKMRRIIRTNRASGQAAL